MLSLRGAQDPGRLSRGSRLHRSQTRLILTAFAREASSAHISDPGILLLGVRPENTVWSPESRVCGHCSACGRLEAGSGGHARLQSGVVPVDAATTWAVLTMGWGEGIVLTRGSAGNAAKALRSRRTQTRTHTAGNVPRCLQVRVAGGRWCGLRPPVPWAMSVVGTRVQSHVLYSWAFVPGSETLHLFRTPPRVTSEPQAFGTPEGRPLSPRHQPPPLAPKLWGSSRGHGLRLAGSLPRERPGAQGTVRRTWVPTAGESGFPPGRLSVRPAPGTDARGTSMNSRRWALAWSSPQDNQGLREGVRHRRPARRAVLGPCDLVGTG